MDYMSPDPLSANWSYDSAIDLFSFNTNTPFPEAFPMDIPNDMFWGPKDLPADFFAAPTDINGFTIPNEDFVSSDQESDDPSYSPTNFTSTPPSSSLDLPSPQPPSQLPNNDPPTRKPSTTPTSTTCPSSPDLPPQEHPTSTSRKTPRSRTSDDVTTRGRNAAKRAAHNIIEKRYRTNMNAKFVALEKAISGSTSDKVSKPSSGSAGRVKGSSSASLKKSEILSNAIAYMQELQETNDRLRREVAALQQSIGRGVSFE
ncbi:hypothetical protein BJX61DRAFT_539699 [Aspergillus egyptiacus]|nr:hypothetical protein BJX61DRAFT_539699 [Aspergillus egyptiacus]